MTNRKTPGSKGTGNDEGGYDVLTFTPSPGFDIRLAAGQIKELMEDLGQPVVIHLPKVSVEFEVGCTRKEIIDGYNRALRLSMNVQPANAPSSGQPKKKKAPSKAKPKAKKPAVKKKKKTTTKAKPKAVPKAKAKKAAAKPKAKPGAKPKKAATKKPASRSKKKKS